MPEVMQKKVLEIEYPRRNETIESDAYTFRIAAMPGAKKVELSINGSAWEPCRRTDDSFWYDWFSYGSGDYEACARMQLADGRFHTAEPRCFSVELKNGGERRPMPRRAERRQERHDLREPMARKYVVVVPNRPDVLSQLTELLAREGVNVDSLLMEITGDIASFRFLLEDENSLRPLLESEGYHVVEDRVFRLELANRPGELDQLTRKLAEEGIAIRYLYGTSHGRTTKVILSVDHPEEAFSAVKEFGRSLEAVEA